MTLNDAVTAVLPKLDAASDRISPLVVKEVRQFVRSREFLASFGVGLCLAMAIASYGSADALGGNMSAGRWTFTTLTVCIALLGLAVVPLGAFSALRNERLEQTLDLISLTTLSPRQIIVGKLLAQGVKLTTFFAVMAPFMATSFLLGGIDFITIVLALVTVFLWSMWAAAAALFLSTLFTSRLMTGLAFGGLGIILFVGVNVGRVLFFSPVGAAGIFGVSAWTARLSWSMGVMVVACLMTMANLVLLAEHRLALPTQNTLTSVRIGFLVQFLLIVAWALVAGLLPLLPLPSALAGSVLPGPVTDVAGWMTVVAGVHLGAVALFSLTALPDAAGRPWTRRRPTWVNALLGVDGWPVTIHILVQMAVLVSAALAVSADPGDVRRLLAVCGCICLFTGVPALLLRKFHRYGIGSFQARGLALTMVFASLVAADIGFYVLAQPETFSLTYSWRHTFNPLRTLLNWNIVELRGWHAVPLLWSTVGLVSYVIVTALDLRARESLASPEPVTLSLGSSDDGAHA